MLEGDQQKIAVELKKFEGNRFHPLLKFLAEMEGTLNSTRTGLIASLIVVAIHCILSAACLWWMSNLNASAAGSCIQITGGIVVLLFALVLIEIITAAQVTLDSKPFVKFFPFGPKIWRTR